MPRTVTIYIPDGHDAAEAVHRVARLLKDDYREGFDPRWTIDGEDPTLDRPVCDHCGEREVDEHDPVYSYTWERASHRHQSEMHSGCAQRFSAMHSIVMHANGEKVFDAGAPVFPGEG